MNVKPKYYLKSISRRWQVEVQKLTEVDKLIILSPYLTSKTAEAVLDKSKVRECEIYTLFSLHNFVAGASSLKTLKILCQTGCKIYHLPRLHAKMVIAPGKFATIGSQNLTRNGVKNKEASLITFDEKEIYKIEHALDKWLVQRQLITLRMIESLEKKITSFKRKSSLINRDLRKEINNLEQEFWKNQAEYIEQERLIREAEELRIAEEKAEKLRQAQLEEKAREAENLRQVQLREEERHWQDEVNSARQRVQKVFTHGEIDEDLAKEFIRESAFWDHPSGSMVSAPKHASRIYGSPNN